MQIIGRRADVLRIRPEPNSRSLVVILGDAVQEHLSVYICIFYCITCLPIRILFKKVMFISLYLQM